LTSLSPEVADALAKHHGTLSLQGLTSLLPEVAQILAKHNGTLRLDNLTTLSPETADVVAKHKGVFRLNEADALGYLFYFKILVVIIFAVILSQVGVIACLLCLGALISAAKAVVEWLL